MTVTRHLEVFNQPPPLEGYDVFESDTAARRGARARGRGLGARTELRELGRAAGGARRCELGPPGEREPAGAAARTTATATASTRSSSTPPGTS